jgi:hypothetical protein
MLNMSLGYMLRTIWTALLCLAVASAWSSAGVAAGPPVEHVSVGHAHAEVSAQTGHAHMAADSQALAVHAHHLATPDTQAAVSKESAPTGMSCCVMTICHPALPVQPVRIAQVATGGAPAPARLPRTDGNEPASAKPPPRDFLV